MHGNMRKKLTNKTTFQKFKVQVKNKNHDN